MPKVSVIVPVYKVEKYLDRCVASLLTQTLKDIEIILVDDGSPDACPQMCDDYARLEPRIRVIHKENAGLGFARNTGLDAVTGDYVGFLDSDDYVDPEFLEKLYRAAISHSAQLAMAGFRCLGGIMSAQEGNVQYINCFRETTVFEGKEGIDRLMLEISGALPNEPEDSKYGFSCVKNLFSTEVIRSHNIRFFSERKVMSEDVFFVLDYLNSIECAVGVDGVYYNYCRNSESISKSYRGDRFEKCQYLIGEINRRLSERIPKERYELYSDRLLQAYARASCMQEIEFSKDNGLTRRELIGRLKRICRSDALQTVLKRYPWHKLPPKQALFAFTMRYSALNLQIMLVRLKYRG